MPEKPQNIDRTMRLNANDFIDAARKAEADETEEGAERRFQESYIAANETLVLISKHAHKP